MNYKNYTFHWEADYGGIKNHGDVEAPTKALAAQKLLCDGYSNIVIVKKRYLFFNRKKITFNAMTLFLRELSLLFNAGIPIISCFDIILLNLTTLSLQDFVTAIKSGLLNGLSLSDAFAKQAQHVDNLTHRLIACGEYSGTLSNTLQQIVLFREKKAAFHTKIMGILFYPMIIFSIAFIILLFMLLYIIPKFSELLLTMGAKLPYCTQLLLTISLCIRSHYFLILLLIIFVVLFIFYKKNFWITLLKKLPFLKRIIHKTLLIQLLDALYTCLKAGITIDKALALTQQFSFDVTINQEISKMVDYICAGHALSHAMEKCRLFPPKVIQLTTIAEQSGTLEDTLYFMAQDYQQQLDNTLSLLSRVIEPVIISVLGLLIGGMVIALYLPIFKLGEGI